MSLEEIFGPTIYRYTRKEAIEDGTLVDLTRWAKPMGFKYPIACTSTVYHDIIDNQEPNLANRLFDFLLSAKEACRRAGVKESDRDYYQFNGHDIYIVVGPGDEAEPVLTIMYKGED